MPRGATLAMRGYRRGAPTQQMPLRRRNPLGAWVLRDLGPGSGPANLCVARRQRCPRIASSSRLDLARNTYAHGLLCFYPRLLGSFLTHRVRANPGPKMVVFVCLDCGALFKIRSIRKSAMTYILLGVILLICPLNLLALDSKDLPPLNTVPYVDLNRYMGIWYEIASFPQWFQKGCVASNAVYTLRKDGDVDVVNQCRDKTLDGELRKAKGKAWVVDRKTNAKLKVRFFWPFSGDYWIIDLSRQYEYAVVGHPKRNYLWILSRTPHMDSAVYQGILERLNEQHYDLSHLQRTLQPAEVPPQ
jgi:apolipoprotein D and lipocalin family protein